MVLLDSETKPEPAMEFEIEALIVHHSTTIKAGYQDVVHCLAIRQTCTVVQMDKEYLRANDVGIIKFRFLKKPEYMHVGDTILFREGRTRGKGKIIKVYPIDLNNAKKDKKTNINKNQQPKINGQINFKNNVKNGKKYFYKKNDENENINQINEKENKNPLKKKDG